MRQRSHRTHGSLGHAPRPDKPLRDRVPSSGSASHRLCIWTCSHTPRYWRLSEEGAGCRQSPFRRNVCQAEAVRFIRPGSLKILSNCDQIEDRARSRMKIAPIRVSCDARLSGCLSVRPKGNHWQTKRNMAVGLEHSWSFLSLDRFA